MATSANQDASLKDSELSAMYVSSDKVSGERQKRTKFSVKVELIGLIIASVFGILGWKVGTRELDVPAAISGLAFAASLASTAIRASRKPEGDWYVGRACGCPKFGHRP